MQQVATPNPTIAAPKVKGGESRAPQSASEQSGDFSEHFTRQQAANEARTSSGRKDSAHPQAERASASSGKSQPVSDKQQTDSKPASETGKAANPEVNDEETKGSEKTQPQDKAADSDKLTAEKQPTSASKGATGSDQEHSVEDDKTDKDQHWLDLIQELADQHISQQEAAEYQASQAEAKSLDAEQDAPPMAQWLQQLGLDVDKVLQELSGEQRQQLEAMMAELQGAEGEAEPKALMHFLDKLTRFLQQESAGKGKTQVEEDMPLDPKWLNGQTQKLLQAIRQANNNADSDEAGQLAKVSVQDLAVLRQQLTAQGHEGTDQLTIEKLSDEALQQMSDKLLGLQNKGTAGESSTTSGSVAKSTASTADQGADLERTLRALARLSDTQLEQALSQASQALTGSEDTDKNSFIGSLKAGVEEIKAQLKQGREPGLDLKALVAQALSSQGESGDKQNAILQDAIQRLSSLAESPSRLQASSQASTPADVINTTMAAERAGLGQVEVASGAKSTQAQPSPSGQMERAINIAKSEAAQQLADRVRMLVDQGNMSADIRLDPPDLGSMQIRVQMNGEQASVNMTVQNQQAKEMLDQAMPRLRELLSEKGIELGQSSVEQEQQQAGDEGGSTNGSEGAPEGQEGEQGEDQQAGIEMNVVNGRLGGIDYFV